MITLFPYVVLICAFIVFLKRKHQRFVERKYKYRLHKIRDDLRRLGATGVIDPQSAIFGYYDESFSKNIQQSYYLTLPGMAYIYSKHKSDPNLAKFSATITEETKKYPDLVRLREKASKATQHYVLQQEVLFHIAYGIALMVFKFRWLKRKVKKLIDSVFWMPETSAMEQSMC